MTFQIHYFYITGNNFTFAVLVIVNFLHVQRELHILNYSPSRSEEKNLPRPVHIFQLYFNIGSIHQKMESGSTNCVTKKSDYMYVFIHKIQPSHCQCLCHGLQINMYSFKK